MKYYHDSRDKPGNYFPMPKSIFRLGLTSGEILVYAYLMYCEDRKTFQCHPSFSTIGEAVGMSNNTVKKYVRGLEHKGLITTEHTKIKTRDGRVHNGSLLYTLKPIEPIEERYFQKVLAEQASKNAVQNALARYQEKRANTMKGGCANENEDNYKNIVKRWERIFLEEGAEGLMKERRGRACKASGSNKGRPPKLDRKVEEDLIAENQRLKMEIEYLKKLSALVLAEEQKNGKKRS